MTATLFVQGLPAPLPQLLPDQQHWLVSQRQSCSCLLVKKSQNAQHKVFRDQPQQVGLLQFFVLPQFHFLSMQNASWDFHLLSKQNFMWISLHEMAGSHRS